MSAGASILQAQKWQDLPTGLFHKSFRCSCSIGISKGQLELQRRVGMQFAPQSYQHFREPVFQSRRAMNAYMTADAEGDQQIRAVAAVAMMNHQRRLLATTTAAKAVTQQHPFAQTIKKPQRMMPPIIT